MTLQYSQERDATVKFTLRCSPPEQFVCSLQSGVHYYKSANQGGATKPPANQRSIHVTVIQEKCFCSNFKVLAFLCILFSIIESMWIMTQGIQCQVILLLSQTKHNLFITYR